MQVNNENDDVNRDRQWFKAMSQRETAEKTTIVGAAFREFITGLPVDAPTGPYNVYMIGQDNPVNDMPYETFALAHTHAASLSNWNIPAEVREIGRYNRPLFVLKYTTYKN